MHYVMMLIHNTSLLVKTLLKPSMVNSPEIRFMQIIKKKIAQTTESLQALRALLDMWSKWINLYVILAHSFCLTSNCS